MNLDSLSDIDPSSVYGGLDQHACYGIGSAEVTATLVEYLNFAVQGIPSVKKLGVDASPALFPIGGTQILALVEERWLRNWHDHYLDIAEERSLSTLPLRCSSLSYGDRCVMPKLPLFSVKRLARHILPPPLPVQR